jgi:hypothetical protein
MENWKMSSVTRSTGSIKYNNDPVINNFTAINSSADTADIPPELCTAGSTAIKYDGGTLVVSWYQDGWEVL